MKTVIIGLDGATFDLITPLARAGRLPVLSRLMREGSWAPLRSTLLPNSFPGWASCTTGTTEGMHGIFSPFLRRSGRYDVRAVSGGDVRTKPIWTLLTEAGGRSVVVNLPTTYPPEPLNGLMVTGMLTPDARRGFTFPPELADDIRAALPAYVIEPGRDADKHARAAAFRHATEMHERVTHLLMERGDFDLLVVVFTVLDRAQHDYWADMDATHPRHDPTADPAHRTVIADTYAQLDAAVGRIVERLPGAARVLIVSDHGFCSELWEVRVNEYLAGVGLLAFKTPALRRSRATLRELRARAVRRVAPAPRGSALARKAGAGGAFLDEIDWRRTRAFFAQDKGIWINLAAREPAGAVPPSAFESVVEETRRALLDLRGPAADAPLCERVLRREEAFAGRAAERLPDLVIIPRDDRYVLHERPSYGPAVVAADTTSGTHARDGIFIAWGRGVRAQATLTQQPRLWDVGATALASLGCGGTEDMDGRVLDGLFDGLAAPAPRGSSYRDPPAEGETSAYGPAAERALERRLRALGYLD